jgi:protein SCO1/2
MFSRWRNAVQGVAGNSFFVLLFAATVLSPKTAFGNGSTTMAADIALEEKLGQSIPDDLVFTDEFGIRIKLKDCLDKPVIIAPVYLNCGHSCPLLLSGLAQTLGRLELIKPGRDFTVITLSFDEKDKPALALSRKLTYLKAVARPFPPDTWKFLTGDKKNINKFTNSIGYKVQRDGADFSHPIALVVVSPQGKIIRYLEGMNFLPFDVTMAVTEAAEGRVGSPMHKALTYCFSYDPLKKSYVFNILKIAATVMVLFVSSLLLYLVFSSKKKRETP